MALPITTKTDYTGRVRISTAKGTQLDVYITEFEAYYIKLLVNNEVYNDINTLADPLPQKYLDLIDGVNYTDSDGDYQIFTGLKEILKKLIYSEYNKDNFQTSIGGNVRSVNENSTVLTKSNTDIIVRTYNEAIDLYRNELCLFLDEHENYKETITSSVEALGVYTISIPSTKYLNDGSIVTINGTDYTVSNVVADTSFEINDTTGKDFTGLEVRYEPFYEFCPKHLTYASWL